MFLAVGEPVRSNDYVPDRPHEPSNWWHRVIPVIRFSTSWTCLSKNLVKLAVFAILLLLPAVSHETQTSTPSQASAPILRVGDTWHYHYTGSGNYSTEQIVRSETCGLAQCVVDQENNPDWNDTSVISEDWNLSREYFADHKSPYNSSSLYTPALHLYQFPLQVGESWWWNSTFSGWYKNQFGNFTQAGDFSIMRRVINQTTVTVPAGTFDTYLVAGYVNGTMLNQYRWFSTGAKTSVKWVSFDIRTSSVFNSYVMTSYSLTAAPSPAPNPSPSPKPSPNPTPTSSNPNLPLTPALLYSIVGAVLAAIVVTVVAVALLSRRKEPVGDVPWNPPAEITWSTGET